MRKSSIIQNENCFGFQDYLQAKFVSERTIRNYLTFVNSSVVRRYLLNVDNIYQLEKFEDIIKLYLDVKEDKDNIRLHRVYSAAVSKYIKFRFPNKKIPKSY